MWRTFNILLERVNLNDPTGHLLVVNVSFDYEKATPRQCIYNEIYPPIIKKQKIIDIAERSVYQLLEQYTERGDGKPKCYCASKKRMQHSFNLHYSFKQKRFKQNFILINQKSR